MKNNKSLTEGSMKGNLKPFSQNTPPKPSAPPPAPRPASGQVPKK